MFVANDGILQLLNVMFMRLAPDPGIFPPAISGEMAWK
jgi:hypothetical protein